MTRGSTRRALAIPGRGRLAVVVLVAIVFLAAGLGLRWWSHPATFRDVGAHGLTVDGKLEPGRGMVYGMSYVKKGVDSRRVTVTDVQPNVVENTSRATFRVQVCTMNQHEVGAIGSGFPSDLRRECVRVVPLKGRRCACTDRSRTSSFSRSRAIGPASRASVDST